VPSGTDCVALVNELAGLPSETEWVEFKRSNDKPDEIGEYVSAIANAAALYGRDAGYIVWGIADSTHELVGTAFRPRRQKIGNEGLEPWLARLLEPRICFRIHEVSIEDKHFVIFEVPAATHTPVRFKEMEYIRVGSYKKKLLDYPERERQLWDTFSRAAPLERQVALSGVPSNDVLDLLDVSAYFDLTHSSFPGARNALLAALEGEDFVRAIEEDSYDITRMGALLLAKDLKSFPQLWRKAVRVVLYEGSSRVRTVREHDAHAIAFDDAHAREQRGELLRARLDLRVGQRVAEERGGRCVGHVGGGDAEDVEQRASRIVEMRTYPVIVVSIPGTRLRQSCLLRRRPSFVR